MGRLGGMPTPVRERAEREAQRDGRRPGERLPDCLPRRTRTERVPARFAMRTHSVSWAGDALS
ncbi:hypothetical protein [Micromonospora matsumotoense]|uniref:hypothetical protein n=1 Tax=Micromonospora matsumotoense TaxID=121616 RepID=UPI00114CF598|nr:hypothetical protein [Micromonospora matsumotoense]